MTFDISQATAIWAGNTAKRIAQGFATEGIGLPAAVILSAKEYYTDVRNVTPPANGGTVASLAFNRGKASIDIDLNKAFRVVQKVTGKTVAAPFAWYLNQRNSSGRFSVRVKADITLGDFQKIQKELHRRVGWMQSGWNSALNRVGGKIPNWVKDKTGPGTVIIQKSVTAMTITARNDVRQIRSVNDMQRRIAYVEKRHKQRLEKAALKTADKALNQMFQ